MVGEIAHFGYSVATVCSMQTLMYRQFSAALLKSFPIHSYTYDRNQEFFHFLYVIVAFLSWTYLPALSFA